VRDPETDKLIRKIPADEMLDLAASIENMVGLFLDKAL
jgi:flagellar protein FlaG